MKVFNLVRSEFIKNYSVKRFIVIILMMIVFSIGFVKITEDEFSSSESYNSLAMQIHSFERSNDYYENKKENFENKYVLYSNEKHLEYWKKIADMGVTSSRDWKVNAVFKELVPFIMENYLIDIIRSDTKDKEIIDIYESGEEDLFLESEKELNYLFNNYSLEELEEVYNKNLSIIEDYENLFEKDKYYLYLEYQVENKIIEDNDFVEILIDKKVDSNLGYLGLNYHQYNSLEQNLNQEILNEKEFNESLYKQYASYDAYLAYNKKIKNDAIKYREILLYSTKHEIKHDIVYNYNDNVNSFTYMNSKLSVKQIFHFSILITLIIAILNSGIVSKEHNKGTIKNIITTPVKRWKILLSKFIYLILDMYLMWFLALIILSIFAGIENGFYDLFTPKIIYVNGNVMEVNYYLYLLKDLFLASIPIICFLSILFFLSTVSLNTSLTVGVMSGLAILSPALWMARAIGNFKYIVYTPILYFDSGFILNNSEFFVESLAKVSYSFTTGIWISLIFIILLYVINNIIYIKRDIKN